MPIYNGENYIHASIQRILNNAKDLDIELILVNDGSTDNSLDICQQYAKQNKCIKLINKANGGICSARNAGLEAATGEYISFYDQDDEICDGIYSAMMQAMKESHCDLVVAGKEMSLVGSNGETLERKQYHYGNRLLADERDIVDLILNKNRNIPLLHIWNCLYRKEIIDAHNIRFDETFKKGMEDGMFNIEYAVHCKTIATTDYIVYRYFRRKSISTSTKRNDNFITDFEHFTDVMFKAFEKGYQEKYLSEVFFYILRFAVKIFYYGCDYGMNPSEFWKKLYTSLKSRHKAKRKFACMFDGYFFFIWFVWLLSDLRCYTLVALTLKTIKKGGNK